MMSSENNFLHLPTYRQVINKIKVLVLSISASELHGIMCGYLCAGAASDGENYLRALFVHLKKSKTTQAAALTLFDVYSTSQHQMINFDFEFQLLLPNDKAPLLERARAFSEWCAGFIAGMTMAGVDDEQLHEEESKEALQHISEFAELDYESLHVDEEDEKALVEVSEYARMAVLRLYGDLLSVEKDGAKPLRTH